MVANQWTQTCEVCGDLAVVHTHVACDRKWIEIHHFCKQHIDEMLARHFPADPVGSNVERPLDTEALFDIELLIACSDGPQDGVYYLREQGGSRRFCSTMGYCESGAMYLNLQPAATPQPGVHRSFARTISALGGTSQDVLIYGFSETENHFRAYLRIRHMDEVIEVDVRPSDALNLAVVCNVPIFVSEKAWRTYMRKSGPDGDTLNTSGPAGPE